jgi:hypothetical protein
MAEVPTAAIPHFWEVNDQVVKSLQEIPAAVIEFPDLGDSWLSKLSHLGSMRSAQNLPRYRTDCLFWSKRAIQ